VYPALQGASAHANLGAGLLNAGTISDSLLDQWQKDLAL
jgi:hypothetical protein